MYCFTLKKKRVDIVEYYEQTAQQHLDLEQDMIHWEYNSFFLQHKLHLNQMLIRGNLQ